MTDPLDPHAFHLGLEAISDFDEGLLNEQDAHSVQEHLTGCAQCRDDQTALAAVRDALAGERDIAMPDDVAGRIFGALAALPPLSPADITETQQAGDGAPVGASVTTLPPRRRPSSWQRAQKPALAWLGAAAAVALLVVGITNLPHGSSTEKSASSAAATSAAPAMALTHSGVDYTAGNLGAQALRLLPGGPTSAAVAPAATSAAAPAPSAAAPAVGGSSAAASAAGPAAARSTPVPAQVPDSGAGATSDAASSPQPGPDTSSPTGDPLAALRVDGAAQTCLMTLRPEAGPPLAIDFATFNGKPAVIGVFGDPTNSSRLQIVAAGPPGCALYSFALTSRP